MNVYAESSAILAWLLDEPSSAAVRRILNAADIVVASDLTIIECDRVLHRAVALGDLSEVEAAERRARLTGVSTTWSTLRISGEVVERARLPFPGDPIRTLDAIHLASALVARGAVPGLELLSLDSRVRAAGSRLGFECVPALERTG